MEVIPKANISIEVFRQGASIIDLVQSPIRRVEVVKNTIYQNTFLEITPKKNITIDLVTAIKPTIEVLPKSNIFLDIVKQNLQIIDTIESSKILPSVGTIPPLTTGIVESIPYAGFFSARYFVALQAASGKTSSFDYSITTDNAGDIFEAIFGKIPGTLNYNVISIVVGSNINFTIHNNESTILTWKVQKLGF